MNNIFCLFFDNFIHINYVSPTHPPYFDFLPPFFCPEPLPKESTCYIHSLFYFYNPQSPFYAAHVHRGVGLSTET